MHRAELFQKQNYKLQKMYRCAQHCERCQLIARNFRIADAVVLIVVVVVVVIIDVVVFVVVIVLLDNWRVFRRRWFVRFRVDGRRAESYRSLVRR